MVANAVQPVQLQAVGWAQARGVCLQQAGRHHLVLVPGQMPLWQCPQAFGEIQRFQRAVQRRQFESLRPAPRAEVAGQGLHLGDIVACGRQQQGQGATAGVADQLEVAVAVAPPQLIERLAQAIDYLLGEPRVRVLETVAD